ncbi:MAG: 4a-hydroxytetrahydrobiopterin dehydratase [Gammaproteobacteria bacterium]|nr:MAG: 4a-hydroxytetrahydrobiopterin dehydratase [Gammaproteobacteria bacterium]
MAAKLEPAEVAARLRDLDGWMLEDGKLRREYRFRDFVQAFGFMASAALAAEKMNHHPDWCNVYNKVIVMLWTHEAGGITALDFQLAEIMNALADPEHRSG